MTSPTQRSLKELRNKGYLVAIVEYYNSFIYQRKDLFGIFDLLAIKENETIGVQVTTMSNKSSHLDKMRNSEYLPIIKLAGWKVELHSWRKIIIGKYKNGNPKRGWVNDITKI